MAPLDHSSLEDFRGAAASGDPTPAGVAVAAASASFALALLAKALAVSCRKKTPSANRGTLEPLRDAARAESSRMLRLAAADVEAFEAYLAGARLPHATDQERIEREQTLGSALRHAIEVPLAAARSAAAGLQWCGTAVSLAHLRVLADVAAALTLLQGALRAFLLCAESNVRQLAPETSSYGALLAAETVRVEQVLRQAEEALERLAARLAAAPPGPEA